MAEPSSLPTILKNFSQQFLWKPVIDNKSGLNSANHFTVVGMGGSHLAADLIHLVYPQLNLMIHSDYGLPSNVPEDTQVILSSYSGETEEDLSAFDAAISIGKQPAVIAKSGRLLDRAKELSFPYVALPQEELPPRYALGYSLLAHLALMGKCDEVEKLRDLSKNLREDEAERCGQNYAEKLAGRIPLIYSSAKNLPLAYIWKINLNETAKVPAFINFFPELNHNELEGFDVFESTRPISQNFAFIFLMDHEDDPRIQKRMQLSKVVLESKGFLVLENVLVGETLWQKVFNSLLTADWLTCSLSQMYEVPGLTTPLIEEFKAKMRLNP